MFSCTNPFGNFTVIQKSIALMNLTQTYMYMHIIQLSYNLAFNALSNRFFCALLTFITFYFFMYKITATMYFHCLGGMAVRDSQFGKPRRGIVYNFVSCRGTEYQLRDCTHTRLNPELTTGNVAGVMCDERPTTITTTVSPSVAPTDSIPDFTGSLVTSMQCSKCDYSYVVYIVDMIKIFIIHMCLSLLF